jgi:SagB-type dehydrogenase family enzyme
MGEGMVMKKHKTFIFVILLTSLFLLFSYSLDASKTSSSSSIGQSFHQKTKHTLLNVLRSVLKWESQPPLYKKYPKAKKIKLPKLGYEGLSLEEALRTRRSIRDYTDKPLLLNALSQLLFSAQGVTDRDGDLMLRTAPSAGALYPIEIYVVVNNVAGLEKGIYHYTVPDHELELTQKGDFRRKIIGCALDQEMAGESDVTFILTAIFQRVTWKYEERGYRYAYMEAGHIGQNIALQAASLGLGAVGIGAFYDDDVNKLIGIDGKSEAALYLYAVGTL